MSWRTSSPPISATKGTVRMTDPKTETTTTTTTEPEKPPEPTTTTTTTTTDKPVEPEN